MRVCVSRSRQTRAISCVIYSSTCLAIYDKIQLRRGKPLKSILQNVTLGDITMHFNFT